MNLLIKYSLLLNRGSVFTFNALHDRILILLSNQKSLCSSSPCYCSTNGREARNRAEKNRRDKLNTSIQELATIVPHVADSPRRVDKTAVLRLAAHGFRLNHVFKNSMDERGRSSIADAVLQMVNGFMLTVSCGGQIVLVSSSLEQHLGHCQVSEGGERIIQFYQKPLIGYLNATPCLSMW